MKLTYTIPFIGLVAAAAVPGVQERGLFPSFSFPAGLFPTSFPFPKPKPSSVKPISTYVPPKSSATVKPVTSKSAIVTYVPPTPTATSTPPTNGNCSPQGNGGGSTESGVLNGNCCTDVTIIYARGTGEGGNVGYVAGPPMFKSLRSKIGANRVTVQGVDYPADNAGNSNLGGSGGPTMAADVKQALAQCPNTKIVVSGYSQGGMVVHNAFSSQGLTSSQVKAAVLFGDPFNGQGVGNIPSANIKEYCASGDSVCDGSGTFAITSAHTTYGNNADDAANFIIQALGL